MDNLLFTLSDTPWWVYVLFIYLLAIGVKASRPRGVPMSQLPLLPLLTIGFSLYTVLPQLERRYPFVYLWLSVFSLAVWIGVEGGKRTKCSIDKMKRMMYLKGSWTTLYFLLGLFLTQYILSYIYSIFPETTSNPYFFLIEITTTGAAAGFFTGQCLAFLNRYRNCPG